MSNTIWVGILRTVPGGQSNSRLEDEHGNSIAHQWAQASTIVGDRTKLVFRAPVPAFGYRQFRLRRVSPAAQPASAVHASDRELENEHLRVRFGEDGTLSIFDKDAGTEIFQGGERGARAVVLDDPSDTWSHDVRAYTKEVGAFGARVSGCSRTARCAPRFACARPTARPRLQTDWLLYAGARTLEARVALDWHEHLKILKFSFPMDVRSPGRLTKSPTDTRFARLTAKKTPGSAGSTSPAARAKGEYGLAVINDAKYGYSVQDNDLRISIARGAVFAQHQPRKLEPNGEYLWQDQGEQTFRMLLVPHPAPGRTRASCAWRRSSPLPCRSFTRESIRRKPAALGFFPFCGCAERGGLGREESGRRRRPHHPLL